jgi:hypothetical protein
MGVDGQRYAPAALPPGKTRYPLYRTRSGPQASLDGCGKSRPPTGFDLQTVQLVASRYTEAIFFSEHRYDQPTNILTRLVNEQWNKHGNKRTGHFEHRRFSTYGSPP